MEIVPLEITRTSSAVVQSGSVSVKSCGGVGAELRLRDPAIVQR